MKVYHSNYRNHWVSPYKICELICFWREIEYEEPWVKFLATVLNPFSEALKKFLDFVHPDINYVKIDRWDVWSMDTSLATIILPMLKELRKQLHGGPQVDSDDVPKELRPTKAQYEKYMRDGSTDPKFFERWHWILDEMIWTFQQLQPYYDWEEQYYTGVSDHEWKPSKVDKNGKVLTWEMINGPKHTRKFDRKGWELHNKRINNGTRLFGKYYRNLWD